MRTGGTSFRRAVAASVGLHLLLAAVVVVAVRRDRDRHGPARPSGVDTRTEVDLRLTFEPGPAVSAPPGPSADPPSPTTPASAPQESGGSRPAPAETPRPPLVQAPAVPRTLPPEMLALLRRPAPDVVEVPVTATPLDPRPSGPPAPAMGTPAGGAGARPDPGPVGAQLAGGGGDGRPVHGALSPGQTIVYVLDASGSMGEGGKFDRARRALVATLRTQPEAVRFQVVVYAGTARLLSAPVEGCAPATTANIDRVASALTAVIPTGRSDHADGLGRALDLRPDVVLILTDANDLSAARLRGVLAQAAKPATVCVAKVTADRVSEPVGLK